ncbi:glyoxalase/bleomycin resistance protein/dioxygenase [Phenylobacterium zucineum HLK1]|uniref:Glyoxalase/bleomycin resistance protein/dioxygenase n=1 Tax=Phenylobacterium zucineum (strain HLK1) TaxID=450851 RepID=B4RCC1_PHEZH|nr:VOC family protein [Phenylobacterium zucineum]ACG76520.1 glyoxalase/bleomycin resistance protein/dioxygenase [Phenylobacterium zucineum HLK1]
MITGLDHVALCVRDLDAAVDGYRRLLGVEPNWLGGDGGARHAWFQLPNMALDVISPHGEGAFGDRMRAQLETHGEGIWALAFTVGRTVDDLAPFAKLLSRRGLRMTEPALTRSTHDDGRKRYWLGSNADPEDTGGLQILLIAQPRDGTPWPLSEPAGPAPVARLDHVVVHTPNPDRALALYGAKLGLDLRLDRENPQWSARQMFFKAGETVVEVAASLTKPVTTGPDAFGGLAWRVDEPGAARARIAAAGFDVSDLRAGRKPGTQVFTVRDAPAGVPTLMLSAEPAMETA